MAGIFDEVLEWLDSLGYNLNNILVRSVKSPDYAKLSEILPPTHFIGTVQVGALTFEVEELEAPLFAEKKEGEKE